MTSKLRLVLLSAEEISFAVDPQRLWDKEHRTSGAEITETDLHYTAFPAAVTFTADAVPFVGPRRQVPLFDFLACAARAVRALRHGEAATLSYTESSDRVHLRPVDGDRVEISATGHRLVINVDRVELLETLTAFVQDGRAQLVDNVPGFRSNPQIGKLAV